MGVHSLVRRRKYSYYLRKRVPAELRAIIGKNEIIKSLDTLKPEEAKTRGRLMALEVDRLFAAARAGVSMTLQDAEALAQEWKRQRLADDADRRATERPRENTVEDNPDLIARALDDTRDALADRDYRQSHGVVRSILADQGISVPEKSPGFNRLAHAVTKATAELLETADKRAGGDWSDDAQSVAHTAQAPKLSPLADPVTRTGNRKGAADNLLLSVVFEKWATERKPPQKTLAEWRTAFRRFRDVVGGDLPIRDVTKAHVREFKDALLRLPARVPKALVKLRVPEIIAKTASDPKVPRLSSTAVAKAITALGSIFSWALKNDYCDINPTLGLKPSDPEANAEKRLPYSIDDLKLILGSRIYADAPADPRKRSADFWLPLLGIFTGCRLEEIGQALVSDVREEAGVSYLDINTVEEGKRAKTKGSRRKVPLHPELIRCGFLTYVESLKTRDERRLFPELKKDSQGTWTGAWSKKWGRYARGLGITDRRKVFHSTRHSFKDACRRAGIEEAISDAFTGHSNGSVGRRYGSGYPVKVLAESMAIISYPDLDLSRLRC